MTTQTFDPQTGRLTNITAGTSGAVENFSYTYDALGNLLTRVDNDEGVSESFTYDGLNRVLTDDIASGTSKSFTYDAVGDITSKSDVGTYTYPVAGSARPHAVQSISGTLNTSFTYDADGNLTAGEGRTISYSAANMPISITQGTKTITFSLDPGHQRFKQVSPEGTTLYMSAFGVLVEEFTGTGGAVQWNQYLYAGGQMVGVRYDYNNAPAAIRYFDKDNLGSIATITDEGGTVVERDAYDVWGKRRFPNGADDPTDSITSLTTRGFTGQEELADVGLVHMNGRVYDPLIGRFTSADPTVSQPFNTQGFDRYAYVNNNPLAFTDPNGYGFFSFIGNILNHIFNPVQAFNDQIGIARAVYSVPYLGTALNIATVAVSAYFCGPCFIGVESGLAALQAGVTSGKLGVALKVGAIVGAEAAATYEAAGISNFALQIAARAAIGCVSAEAEGGDCGPGALSGGLSAAAAPVYANENFYEGVVTSAVIGGVGSVAGGGKFLNGAETGAFQYIAGSLAYAGVSHSGRTGEYKVACLGTKCADGSTPSEGTYDPTSPWLDYAAAYAAGEISGTFRIVYGIGTTIYDLLPSLRRAPYDVTFGHGERHLLNQGLTPEQVNPAIENAIRTQVKKLGDVSGVFMGRVTVGRKIVQFRAYPLPSRNAINVGTYWVP